MSYSEALNNFKNLGSSMDSRQGIIQYAMEYENTSRKSREHH